MEQLKQARETSEAEHATMLEILQTKAEELLRREEEGKTMRLLYESEASVHVYIYVYLYVTVSFFRDGFDSCSSLDLEDMSSSNALETFWGIRTLRLSFSIRLPCLLRHVSLCPRR